MVLFDEYFEWFISLIDNLYNNIGFNKSVKESAVEDFKNLFQDEVIISFEEFVKYKCISSSYSVNKVQPFDSVKAYLYLTNKTSVFKSEDCKSSLPHLIKEFCTECSKIYSVLVYYSDVDTPLIEPSITLLNTRDYTGTAYKNNLKENIKVREVYNLNDFSKYKNEGKLLTYKGGEIFNAESGNLFTNFI